MNSDLSPSYYRDHSLEFAMEETRAVIAHIKEMDPNNKLITSIVTPRFAPSCTRPLLSALGALASEKHLPIQTHISENPSEVELVHSLFPDLGSYADVYDSHQLLTSRTVLAHGVHLSSQERALIKRRGSKISHCPVSNTSLSSGLCPVRELLDSDIEVGLGTDVSGGYSSSVLVAAREASMVSRTLAAITPESKPNADPSKPQAPQTTTAKDHKKLSVEECLYLATRGGAKCLGLGDKIGAFEVGMEWDAQLIELSEASEDGQMAGQDEGLVEVWGKETWSEKVAKWMFCGDDRNTKKVFVRGRLVHERK